MESKRATFASKFGIVPVFGTSVVRLGNIRCFPYLVGESGGAAFTIVYLAVCFTISIPIMLSELKLLWANIFDFFNDTSSTLLYKTKFYHEKAKLILDFWRG